MDPITSIGIASTFTALSSSALETAKRIQTLEDAPISLVQLAYQVQNFASVVELTRNYPISGIEETLHFAIKCLPEIDALMQRCASFSASGLTNTGLRLRWSMADEAKIIRSVRQLRDWASLLGLSAITHNM